jgi:hypothetical protein
MLAKVESIHCGDGEIDDTRIRGRDYYCNVAINADCGMDGLASCLICVEVLPAKLLAG